MTCDDFRHTVKNTKVEDATNALRAAVTAHAMQCTTCRHWFALDELTPILEASRRGDKAEVERLYAIHRRKYPESEYTSSVMDDPECASVLEYGLTHPLPTPDKSE